MQPELLALCPFVQSVLFVHTYFVQQVGAKWGKKKYLSQLAFFLPNFGAFHSFVGN